MDEETKQKTGNCAVCGVIALLKCTSCKFVFYCGVEHQKQHWKVHKIECQRTYEIRESPQLGRYVVAARDLPARTLIFVEAPLVVGPKWSMEEFEKERPMFPCVGCFQLVRINESQCPRCTWPVCSPNCAGLHNPLLHGNECPILGYIGGPSDRNDLRRLMDFYRSDALLILRLILLQLNNPQKWKHLIQLQSHEKERKDTPHYKEADSRIVSYLKTRFLDRLKERNCKIMADFDAETLHRICGIVEVNAHYINLENGQEISGVYPTASILEHSCVPNCMFSFDFRKQFRLKMQSGKDIKKGEHLSIMYTHMLWGTQMRQEHLMINKYFICRCVRCEDPTELGSFLSALKCIGHEIGPCNGHILPLDPYDSNTKWTCSECPTQLESEKVSALIENMDEQVESLITSRESTVDEVETVLKKLSQFLHPNHFHLFALKHSLIQLVGSKPGFETKHLSETRLQEKISMSQELLNLVDLIDPHAIRLSLYTGIVLYEMHLAVIELERRHMKLAKSKGVSYNYDKLRLAERYLVRAKDVLFNCEDSPEGKMFSESVVKASEYLEELFAGIIF